MIVYKPFGELRVGDRVLVTEFGIHHYYLKPRLETISEISEKTNGIILTFTSGQSYFVMRGTTRWTPTDTNIRIWADPMEENTYFWNYLMGMPAKYRGISLLETIQEHIKLDENLQ